MCIPAAFSDTEAASAKSNGDLTQMSLEDLMNTEVTLSRKSETVSQTAAAVYMITQEDIRRCGITSIPEALRLVPGIHVAHINANEWAISSRGFDDWSANKMLVLIDGRSVYTPLFAGVWWDVQDTMIEDIDHIEVIRGPGAALWGANAVNGIVNVVTKNSRDTEYGLITQVNGDEERNISSLRYGGKLGANGSFRVYAKSTNHNSFVTSTDHSADDPWDQSRAGFRMDTKTAAGDALTFQGDFYKGSESRGLGVYSLTAPLYSEVIDQTNVAGKNLMTRWERKSAQGASSAIQLYYDRTQRHDDLHAETRDTFDMDFQRHLAPMGKHDIIWGLGYRYSTDNTGTDSITIFNPSSRTDHLASAFVQDDITLKENRLRLTIGSKFEHNDYTGYEIQPNLRLLWTPKERHTAWMSIARAVRTPTRAEQDVQYTTNVMMGPVIQGIGRVPIQTILYGNPDFQDEYLTAYELGYRVQPSNRLSFDAATFYDVYDDLRVATIGSPTMSFTPIPHLVAPAILTNRSYGESYGGEISSNWRASDNWRLSAAYTWIRISTGLRELPGYTLISEGANLTTPRNLVQLRSYLDLPKSMELDTVLIYVDCVPLYDIPSYWRLDLRLGWGLHNNRELSLGGTNLLSTHHREFGAKMSEVPTEVERSLYLNLSQQF